jgi:hypothetical protein
MDMFFMDGLYGWIDMGSKRSYVVVASVTYELASVLICAYVYICTERCLRCVPQDENTGGFFVTALRKIDNSKAHAPAGADATSTSNSTTTVTAGTSAEDASGIAAQSNPTSSTTTASGGAGNQKGLSDFLVWGEESFNRVSGYISHHTFRYMQIANS